MGVDEKEDPKAEILSVSRGKFQLSAEGKRKRWKIFTTCASFVTVPPFSLVE